VRLRRGQVVRPGLLHVFDLWRGAGLPAHIAAAGAAGMAAIASLLAVADRLSGSALLSLALAASAVGTGLPALLVARRAQQRIAELEQIGGRIAAGDLTVDVPVAAGACTSGT
ncbi:chemotaxis protein, partial [Burkholderia glumae]